MSHSRKLACGVLAAGAPLAAAAALALSTSPAAATGAGGLPVLKLTMNGKSIKVNSAPVSGAVEVQTTVSKEKRGTAILLRLNRGVTPAQVFKAISSNKGDPNAAQLVGAIGFDATTAMGQTGKSQTVLVPDKYMALDVAGKGKPRAAVFTVTKASSPAKLPKATATNTSIEFGFRGPATLKAGTLVRGSNGGWLVHMEDLIGVKSKADGLKVIKLLKAGKPPKAARPYLSNHFFEIFGPVSHAATQQQPLNTKPGYYVEACFMDTQDGRVHTQLGMERLVEVVK